MSINAYHIDSDLYLFDQLLRRGRRRQWIARFFGRCRMLCGLNASTAARARSAQTDTVDIHAIVGSLDRTDDFDRDFNPLRPHTRGRWARIANAMRRGETLPPVDLVRVGDAYYVMDGHHRVSAARALNYQYIDAHVRHYTGTLR